MLNVIFTCLSALNNFLNVISIFCKSIMMFWTKNAHLPMYILIGINEGPTPDNLKIPNDLSSLNSASILMTLWNPNQANTKFRTFYLSIIDAVFVFLALMEIEPAFTRLSDEHSTEVFCKNRPNPIEEDFNGVGPGLHTAT